MSEIRIEILKTEVVKQNKRLLSLPNKVSEKNKKNKNKRRKSKGRECRGERDCGIGQEKYKSI